MGDALAIATIVPLALLSAFAVRFGRPRVHLPYSRAGRAETTMQIASVFAGPIVVVGLIGDERSATVIVLSVLPLIWVALRQELIFTAAGVLATTTLSTLAVRVALPERPLLDMQLVLLTASLAALYAAAVRRTNEELVATLIEHRSRLARLADHAPIEVTEFDTTGNLRAGGPGDTSPRRDDIEGHLRTRWAAFSPAAAARASTFEWTATVEGRPEWFVSSAMPLQRADGAPDGLLVVTTDRTEVEVAHRAAALAARRDELTALPTRVAFLESLDGGFDIVDAAAPDRRTRRGIAVVELDAADLLTATFDRNDTDRLVVDLAARVAAKSHRCAGIARIGPRSFALATDEDTDDGERITAVAAHLLGVLRRELVVGRAGRPVTSTIGVAFDDVPAAELLRRAELAVHTGQPAGGDRVVTYRTELESALQAHRSLVADIRRAADHAEFEAWFQPIVRLDDRHVVGVEALARWRRPDGSVLGPDEFVPIAERTGLIAAIDLAVLEHAVAAIERWSSEAMLEPGFFVSVNISPDHLRSAGLLERLAELATRVDPARLRLEITETCAMHDPEDACRALAEIRSLGYAIILDDFGTGYSSMAWLHRLPVQSLKIDRSFVEGLPDAVDSRRIVELIAALAADLGLDLTAEGVEREAQAACLAQLGCRHGQGFLFGHPAPPSARPPLLASR